MAEKLTHTSKEKVSKIKKATTALIASAALVACGDAEPTNAEHRERTTNQQEIDQKPIHNPEVFDGLEGKELFEAAEEMFKNRAGDIVEKLDESTDNEESLFHETEGLPLLVSNMTRHELLSPPADPLVAIEYSPGEGGVDSGDPTPARVRFSASVMPDTSKKLNEIDPYFTTDQNLEVETLDDIRKALDSSSLDFEAADAEAFGQGAHLTINNKDKLVVAGEASKATSEDVKTFAETSREILEGVGNLRADTSEETGEKTQPSENNPERDSSLENQPEYVKVFHEAGTDFVQDVVEKLADSDASRKEETSHVGSKVITYAANPLARNTLHTVDLQLFHDVTNGRLTASAVEVYDEETQFPLTTITLATPDLGESSLDDISANLEETKRVTRFTYKPYTDTEEETLSSDENGTISRDVGYRTGSPEVVALELMDLVNFDATNDYGFRTDEERREQARTLTEALDEVYRG